MLVIDLGSTVQTAIREYLRRIKEPRQRQLCIRRAVLLASYKTSVLLLTRHPKHDSLIYPDIVSVLAEELESELYKVLRDHAILRTVEVVDLVVVNDRYVGLETAQMRGGRVYG